MKCLVKQLAPTFSIMIASVYLSTAQTTAPTAQPTVLIKSERHSGTFTTLQPLRDLDSGTAWLHPTVLMKGERHSGTTLLQSTLEANFDKSNVQKMLQTYRHANCNETLQPRIFGADDDLSCCTKHGFASNECVLSTPAPTVIVTLLRSPYSWLPSMHASPYTISYETDLQRMSCHEKYCQDFSSFLRAPFPDYRRSNATVYPRMAGTRPATALLISRSHRPVDSPCGCSPTR